MLQICKGSRHVKYHMDENKTFYRPLYGYVFEQKRPTIHEKFVSHKLFSYEHALVLHKSHRFRFVLFKEKHNENVSRVSHVYLKEPWRQLAGEWGLEQNQVLRFKYIKNVVDDQAILFYREDGVKISMFHLC